VGFTKDGCTLYSAGLDGELRFWEAPPLADIDLDLSTKPTPGQARPAGSSEAK
jgi:hypothetical protein